MKNSEKAKLKRIDFCVNAVLSQYDRDLFREQCRVAGMKIGVAVGQLIAAAVKKEEANGGQ